jgi:hypothetical protein
MSVEISIRVTLKTPTLREASVIICKDGAAIQFTKAFAVWLLQKGILVGDVEITKDRKKEMSEFILYLINAGLENFFRELGGTFVMQGTTVEKIVH